MEHCIDIIPTLKKMETVEDMFKAYAQIDLNKHEFQQNLKKMPRGVVMFQDFK